MKIQKQGFPGWNPDLTAQWGQGSLVAEISLWCWLIELAGNLSVRMPGKTVDRGMSHRRHSATKRPQGITQESFWLLSATGAKCWSNHPPNRTGQLRGCESGTSPAPRKLSVPQEPTWKAHQNQVKMPFLLKGLSNTLPSTDKAQHHASCQRKNIWIPAEEIRMGLLLRYNKLIIATYFFHILSAKYPILNTLDYLNNFLISK